MNLRCASRSAIRARLLRRPLREMRGWRRDHGPADAGAGDGCSSSPAAGPVPTEAGPCLSTLTASLSSTSTSDRRLAADLHPGVHLVAGCPRSTDGRLRFSPIGWPALRNGLRSQLSCQSRVGRFALASGRRPSDARQSRLRATGDQPSNGGAGDQISPLQARFDARVDVRSICPRSAVECRCTRLIPPSDCISKNAHSKPPLLIRRSARLGLGSTVVRLHLHGRHPRPPPSPCPLFHLW